MSSRKVVFETNNFYHIYNRGNNKQKIFNSLSDEKRFLALLYLCNNQEKGERMENIFRDHKNVYDIIINTHLVHIHAYCLMPNHFHILLTPLIENGVTIFMQKLSTAYVMYYNKKNNRSGALFEGRFKATHVDNENYLKYVFSYIHLNPIKLIQSDWKEKGIVNKERALLYLDEYCGSSYLDWKGTSRNENKIIHPNQLDVFIENERQFTRDIFYWLSYSE